MTGRPPALSWRALSGNDRADDEIDDVLHSGSARMTRSPTQVVRLLVQATWRRRWLLLVPILIMLPAGFVASKLMPLNYVSRSLLMLQESGETGPLSREPANVPFVPNEERLAALRALLLSDYVLLGVLQDLGIADPAVRAAKVPELRRTIRLEGAGTNFIEIYHSGRSAIGLGKQLETVILKFLEALASEQGEPDAIQILIDKHARNLISQRALKVELEGRLAALPAISPAAAQANMTSSVGASRTRAANLRLADQAVDKLARPLGMTGVETAQQLDAKVAELKSQKATEDAVPVETRVAEGFVPLRKALVEREAAAGEQADAAAAVEAEQCRTSGHEDLKAQIVEAERKIAAEQRQFEVSSETTGVRSTYARGRHSASAGTHPHRRCAARSRVSDTLSDCLRARCFGRRCAAWPWLGERRGIPGHQRAGSRRVQRCHRGARRCGHRLENSWSRPVASLGKRLSLRIKMLLRLQPAPHGTPG